MPAAAVGLEPPTTQRLAHLKSVAEDHMRATYQECDHPERVKDRLLRRLAKGSYAVPLILRQGWQAWVKAVRERLINFAIVSALVLSVMLGQIFSPPTAVSTASSYDTLRTVYVLVSAFGSAAAIANVLGVTLYLKYCEMFVVDLDDFLELHAYFHPKWSIEGAFAVSLLCSGWSIGLGLPLVLEGNGGWAAAVVFITLLTVIFGVWLYRGKRYDSGKKRAIRLERAMYQSVIEDVYRELYEQATAAAP